MSSQPAPVLPQTSQTITPNPCPGCETGCEGDAHIDEKTGTYYKTCCLYLEKNCLWCGRSCGTNDYCDTKCAMDEKRHDDATSAMADYYD